MPLLNEDPTRLRALIFTSAVCFVGDPEQMSGVTAQLPSTGSGGPGARIPAAANSPIVLNTQTEVWVAFTAATEIGVWVEREVPGGAR